MERVVPSHCGQRNCPPGYAGPKCQDLEVDKIPPKVEYCPGDLWFITKNGSALVAWDEPHFSDNVGVVGVQEKSGHRPGQTLLWGIYQIAYVASDAAGNTATCTFKVQQLRFFSLNLPCKIWNFCRCRFCQSFARNSPTRSEVTKRAKIGALADSLRCAKSVVTLASNSLRRFPNFTLAVLKVSGGQTQMLTYLWYIRLVRVSFFLFTYLLYKVLVFTLLYFDS